MDPTPSPSPASPAEAAPAPARSALDGDKTPGIIVLPLRRIGQVAFAIAVLLVAKNLVDISLIRWASAFDPWVAETDQKQIVQQFWGNYIPGAFPPGELLEAYANVYNGPPFYTFIMKSLSTFMSPKDASIVLNIVIWFATLAFLFLTGRRNGSVWVGLAAVLLWAHSADSWRIIAGGHPRSFAPLFIAAFLWAWTAERRRVMLALLVLMGGTYPSVLIACGPVAAVVVGWAWWHGDDAYRRRFRPVAELAVASILALGLAKAQDFRAPREWGEIIKYEDALKHKAFQKGSRIPYTPFPSLGYYPKDAFFRISKPVGTPLIKVHYNPKSLTWAWVAVGAIGAVAWIRDRKKIPYRELLLLGGCFFALVLARKLAFSLSLPHRALSHGWPVLFALLFPLIVWRGFEVLRTRQVAGFLAFVATAGALYVLAGNGVENPKAWRSYSKDKDFYLWIQRNTPLDAIFAGNFQPMDEVPLFGRRRVYVNWKLAHPFRKGYFDIVTERTVKMYDAFYALDTADVVRFAREANVSYFVVDRSRFQKFERGDGQLFEPLRSKVQPFFNRCQRQRCALDPPPEGAVVFHSNRYDIVDIEKLAALVESGGAEPDKSGDPAGPDDADVDDGGSRGEPNDPQTQE
jgi:hypothetical protein